MESLAPSCSHPSLARPRRGVDDRDRVVSRPRGLVIWGLLSGTPMRTPEDTVSHWTLSDLLSGWKRPGRWCVESSVCSQSPSGRNASLLLLLLLIPSSVPDRKMSVGPSPGRSPGAGIFLPAHNRRGDSLGLGRGPREAPPRGSEALGLESGPEARAAGAAR